MINFRGTLYRLHPLFVLLMLSSILTGYFVELITLFGVVAIHEMGHVAAAKSFGWRVRQVQLLPFGGVMAVDESSEVPLKEELAVALCGPLQNGWMAALAAVMLWRGWGDGAYWQYFLQANAMIGLFNMLPALPLDGGRVFFCLISYWTSYHRSLTIVLYASLFLSIMMIVLSLFRYPEAGIQLNLLLIGLFMFYTNWYDCKHLPYQFLRFLVKRERRIASMRDAGARPAPLLVPASAHPMEVFRRLMRDKHHLLYIVGPTGAVLEVWPEVKLLRAYLGRTGPPGQYPAGPRNTGRGPKIG